ncbi:MBL fold metallo-hydrolase [Streptomyces noursei]|uniref:MBL fold metallo-hydrolase n=1 Tax=Streptomyces noursei TaxID=1971 RepID=UPI0033FB00A3
MIRDALAALGGRPEALGQIVLTHCHMDHMGSATGTRALFGPFTVDRATALASFRRLAALDGLDTVCVPHGAPIRSGARAVLAAAVPEADWR